jgi:hypothetical protein
MTAKAFGITVPPTSLAIVDEAIEQCAGFRSWHFSDPA